MALGPQKLVKKVDSLVLYAEKYIDSMINQSDIYPVFIPTDAIKIDYDNFNKFLVPKYIKEGWKVVEWRQDANNNRYYIFLNV